MLIQGRNKHIVNVMNDLWQLENVRNIIDRLRTQFDSHDFIRIFAMCYPEEYRKAIMHYKDLHSAHTQIGNYLEQHSIDLKIKKIDKVKSYNVYNKETEVALWERI